MDEWIFSIRADSEFLEAAGEAFVRQRESNPVYREFLSYSGRLKERVEKLSDIPFLPVEFFRDRRVICGEKPAAIEFRSSGTTGSKPSIHYVTDPGLYERSFMSSFNLFYGDPGKYLMAALLPSYIEREGSSLVYMAERLIKESSHPEGGFYKGDTGLIVKLAAEAATSGRRLFLLGVSFALLDLAESGSCDLGGSVVMETGGMKGRRKEIIRRELHEILKSRFRISSVHSEYGMTELLSQAYSSGDGLFYPPPWMKILIRDPLDPFSIYTEAGRTGGINIIDLANINSCSFIATGDLGRIHDDGSFEVIGRFDESDIRGCNLMAV